MTTEQLKILDECLSRIKNGETVENCLDSHPEIRELLKPLLETAADISAVPKASPSQDFRELSQARLMARIREESKPKPEKSAREKSGIPWSGLWQGLSARPVVAVLLVLVLIAGLCLTVLKGFVSPTDTVHAAEYTLSILEGSAEVKSSDSANWQPAASGLKLSAGTSIRTTEDSYAVLTFLDGSTTKMEPNTDVTVLKSEYKHNNSIRIGLDQQLGKTWNYLQGSGETAPNFEIQTPAAKLVAHGTAFISEVDPAGLTTVAVFTGTVSVTAQQKQVNLTANLQTEVEPGMTPALPTPVPSAQDELVVVTNLPAVASVCDPSGSSTGNLPSGISFSQIAGSSSLLMSDKQRIEVAEPASGEYSIIVRNVTQDTAPVNIQMVHNGQTISKEIEIPDGSGERDWIIRVKLATAQDSTVSTEIVSIEPLKDKTPETIVETTLAKERATPIAVSTANPDSSMNETVIPNTPYPTNTVSPKTPADTDNTGTPETPNDTTSIVTPEPVKTIEPAPTSSVNDDTNTSETPQVATPVPTPEPVKTITPAATSSVKDTTNATKTPQVATPVPTPEPTKAVTTPAATSTATSSTSTSDTSQSTTSDTVTTSPSSPDTGNTGGTGSTGNTGSTGSAGASSGNTGASSGADTATGSSTTGTGSSSANTGVIATTR
jgi:hypothetical protein